MVAWLPSLVVVCNIVLAVAAIAPPICERPSKVTKAGFREVVDATKAVVAIHINHDYCR